MVHIWLHGTYPGHTAPKGIELRTSFNCTLQIPMENSIFGGVALSLPSTSAVILNFSWRPRAGILASPYTHCLSVGDILECSLNGDSLFWLLCAVSGCVLKQDPHSWQVSCEMCLTLVEKGHSWIQEACCLCLSALLRSELEHGPCVEANCLRVCLALSGH